ncbi:hypothetical protein Hdeb2414_s0010g00354901 [Helianthus debilis subsp. tardiflorus]
MVDLDKFWDVVGGFDANSSGFIMLPEAAIGAGSRQILRYCWRVDAMYVAFLLDLFVLLQLESIPCNFDFKLICNLI